MSKSKKYNYPNIENAQIGEIYKNKQNGKIAKVIAVCGINITVRTGDGKIQKYIEYIFFEDFKTH